MRVFTDERKTFWKKEQDIMSFWVTYRNVKDPKPLRNKSWISLVKLVVTIISVTSNTKGNHFWGRYFRRVTTFGNCYTCEILSLLSKGRYFQGVVTLGTLRGIVLASRLQKSGTGDNNFVKSGKWKGTFRSDRRKWPDWSKSTTFRLGPKYLGRTQLNWFVPFDF